MAARPPFADSACIVGAPYCGCDRGCLQGEFQSRYLDQQTGTGASAQPSRQARPVKMEPVDTDGALQEGDAAGVACGADVGGDVQEAPKGSTPRKKRASGRRRPKTRLDPDCNFFVLLSAALEISADELEPLKYEERHSEEPDYDDEQQQPLLPPPPPPPCAEEADEQPQQAEKPLRACDAEQECSPEAAEHMQLQVEHTIPPGQGSASGSLSPASAGDSSPCGSSREDGPADEDVTPGEAFARSKAAMVFKHTQVRDWALTVGIKCSLCRTNQLRREYPLCPTP